jgi:hypothetical protein
MGFYFRKNEGDQSDAKTETETKTEGEEQEVSEYERVFLSPKKSKPQSVFTQVLKNVFGFLEVLSSSILWFIQYLFKYITLGLFIHPLFSCLVTGFIMGLIWWVFFLWLFWKLVFVIDDKYFDCELWDEPKYYLVTIPGYIVFYILWCCFISLSEVIRFYF